MGQHNQTTNMKGYQINLDKISEGYLYSPVFCVAESVNKAKSELLKKVYYDDMKLIHSGKNVTYTTIPVIRYPEADLKDFEGKLLVQHEINVILEKRKREQYFQSIIDDVNITHCYIRKHGSYYRPHASGYTQFRSFAGIYEKNDAIKHGRSCGELIIIPINTEEHNKMIMDEINDFKNRLI